MSSPIIAPLTVTEVDGSPEGRPITTIKVSNGDLTVSRYHWKHHHQAQEREIYLIPHISSVEYSFSFVRECDEKRGKSGENRKSARSSEK